MTHRQALAYLFGLQRFGVKLGLDNIRLILAELGHPERRYPCLLITGSNGKGSVAAMLTAALGAHGLRVGTYTSPHLVRFEERIAVDGRPIDCRRAARACARARAAIDRLRGKGVMPHHPTFFEVVTAMAFDEFARRPVEVAVIEVGLGGRFDATNACEPELSVVTTVALEHTRYLGDTLEKIAFEKAGIARPGRPLVTGVAAGPALKTLRERARAVGATLRVAPRRVRVEVRRASRRGLVLAVRGAATYPTLRLPLPGRHQALNASVAIAALEALGRVAGVRLRAAGIARGLAATRWPGRIEYVVGRPRLLLDGAHNPHAARALARYLREFEPGGPKALVFACLGDKDLQGIVAVLFPLFDRVVLTQVGNPRALGAQAIAAAAPPGSAIEVEPHLARALALGRRLAGRRGLVVATGSLYLVGEVKAILAGAPPPDQG